MEYSGKEGLASVICADQHIQLAGRQLSVTDWADVDDLDSYEHGTKLARGDLLVVPGKAEYSVPWLRHPPLSATFSLRILPKGR